MAISTCQRRGPLAHGAIEVGGNGKSSPAVAIPAAPTQPRRGGQRFGCSAQQSQPVRERGRDVQVDLLTTQRIAAEVHVRIDEPGHHGPTAQIEHPRSGSLQIVEAVVADGDDASVGDGQTARPRLGRVHRHDGRVPEQHVRLHRRRQSYLR